MLLWTTLVTCVILLAGSTPKAAAGTSYKVLHLKARTIKLACQSYHCLFQVLFCILKNMLEKQIQP